VKHAIFTHTVSSLKSSPRANRWVKKEREVGLRKTCGKGWGRFHLTSSCESRPGYPLPPDPIAFMLRPGGERRSEGRSQVPMTLVGPLQLVGDRLGGRGGPAGPYKPSGAGVTTAPVGIRSHVAIWPTSPRGRAYVS